MSQELRIFRYLSGKTAPHHRNLIMHYTGFPSPKDQPVIAYVEFQNAVMRLNARLAPHGRQVVRETGETYRLAVLEGQAA